MCAVGTLTARGAGLALRPHRDGKCRSTVIKILCSRINYGTAWYNKWCWKRAEAQKQIRPSYRFTERLGALELAKLFRKEEERAKNEKQCFVMKIIFVGLLANRKFNNINKNEGLETKEFGEDFPPFLFVLSLSLFLLLSTVLSSLCSWEPLTLPLTNNTGSRVS